MKSTATTQSGPGSDPALFGLWGQLLAERPEATPFHDLRYLHSIAAAVGAELRLFFRIRDGRAVGGAALLFRRRAKLFWEILLPPLTPYSAVFLPLNAETESDHVADDTAALYAAMRSQSNLARIHLAPEQVGIGKLDKKEWTIDYFKTYLSAIRPGVDPMTGWSQNPKRIFRKHAAEYRIRIDNDAGLTACKLNRVSYSRHGRTPLLSLDKMVTLVGEQIDNGLATLFVAENIASGVDDAAIVLLHRNTDAYYWVVGSKPGPAMTVLIAGVFEHCATNDITKFDFVGANTPSIADFKRRFGPSLVNYSAQVLARPTLLRAVRRWKSRLPS